MQKNNLGLSIKSPNEMVFKSGLFSCVEFCVSFLTSEDDFDTFKDKVARLRELSLKYNVPVRSFHLPFCGGPDAPVFLVASPDEKVREKTFENAKRLILDVLPLKPEYVILHGGLVESEEKYDEQVEGFIQYIRKLADFCAPFGISVAVETLKPKRIPGSSDEILSILKEVNRDNVCICFDSNHILGENNADYLKKVGSLVKTTHLSDYDGIDEKHWMIGKGITDWKKIVGVLDDVGFNGPYLFEVKFGGDEPTEEELFELVYECEKLFK